jgi:hypothetical protein
MLCQLQNTVKSLFEDRDQVYQLREDWMSKSAVCHLRPASSRLDWD